MMTEHIQDELPLACGMCGFPLGSCAGHVLLDIGGPDDPEVIHHCPPDGRRATLCCDQTPFDLPRTDRLTLDAALVNCPAIVGKNWCDPCGGWIDGQPCD
jgi:hypothetical protein